PHSTWRDYRINRSSKESLPAENQKRHRKMYGTTYINHAARPATPDPAAGTVGMAPDWLTSSRLHPAPHTQAIARPRLMACCAEAAGQGHIWMALAPAGFGKTVWLTQTHSLLQSAGRPAGWLSLTA